MLPNSLARRPAAHPRVPARAARVAAPVLASLLAACAGPPGAPGGEPPALTATFATASETATDCLARALGSVRLRDGNLPLRVDARTFAGSGTVTVRVPSRDAPALTIRVARDGETRATAVASSAPVAGLRMQAALGVAARRAIEACNGEVVDDRIGPRLPSRIG